MKAPKDPLFISFQITMPEHGEIIVRNQKQLLLQLDTVPIIEGMREKNIISEDTKVYLLSFKVSYHRRAALLSYLRNTGSQAYTVFKDILSVIQPNLYDVLCETENSNFVPADARLFCNIGASRYLTVKTWQDGVRIDIREWNAGDEEATLRPTKKGVSLTCMRWKELLFHAADIDEAVENVVNNRSENFTLRKHIGGNFYVTVQNGFPTVDIRKFFMPPGKEELVATRKGIALKISEWEVLKERRSLVEFNVPELANVMRCMDRGDHMNQEGAIQCLECNPNDDSGIERDLNTTDPAL